MKPTLDEAVAAVNAALALGDHVAAVDAADAAHPDDAMFIRHQLVPAGVLAHPRARVGESAFDLIERAKTKHHGGLRVASCQSALHSTRANVADGRQHSDELGVYDGVIPPPHVCERCAFYDREAREKARVAKRDALKAALRVDDAALDALVELVK